MVEELMNNPPALIGLAVFCLACFAVAGWFVREATDWFNRWRF